MLFQLLSRLGFQIVTETVEHKERVYCFRAQGELAAALSALAVNIFGRLCGTSANVAGRLLYITVQR